MSIKIENLVPQKNVEIIKTAGLHRIIGIIEGGEEVTIKQAARLIGAKAYLRRCENKKIAAGIEALKDVTEV